MTCCYRKLAHLELVLVATVAFDGLQRASFLVQNYAVLNTAGTPVPARATFSIFLELQPAASHVGLLSCCRTFALLNIYPAHRGAGVLIAPMSCGNLLHYHLRKKGGRLPAGVLRQETTCCCQHFLAVRSVACGLCPWQLPYFLGLFLEAFETAHGNMSGGESLFDLELWGWEPWVQRNRGKQDDQWALLWACSAQCCTTALNLHQKAPELVDFCWGRV